MQVNRVGAGFAAAGNAIRQVRVVGTAATKKKEMKGCCGGGEQC